MDTFEWAVAILAVTICFGPGLAAVTTAWLFPWLRGSIERPYSSEVRLPPRQ
jgi:hypothetical protein